MPRTRKSAALALLNAEGIPAACEGDQKSLPAWPCWKP